jgi:plasmid maintenance system antidote protein VapI
LARYFGTTADFWLNLQKDYELRQARQAAQREIDARVTPMTA